MTTAGHAPGTDTLVGRFDAVCAVRGSTAAVVDGKKTTSYAELRSDSVSLARSLERAGVAPGDHVGVAVGAGADWLVAVIAVVRLGAVYVPLDVTYPAQRLRFLVADSAVTLILCDQATQTRLPDGCPTFDVAAAGRGRERLDALPGPARRGAPDDIAYVIYTSGSTGEPKGVQVSHGNVLALLDATSSVLGLPAPAQRWSWFHSPSFDFSVWETWAPLTHGGTVVCVPPLARLDPTLFQKFLVRERIGVLNMVPSVFTHLLAGGGAEARNARAAVECVVFGGEAFNANSVMDWFRRTGDGPGPRIVNMFGITETTVHVTYREMTASDLRRSKAGSLIGLPLPHLGLSLLTPDGEPVSPGEPGEMWVSGDGVALGYLDRPVANSERFAVIEGPTGPVRAYRSGDSAYWSSTDSSFVYVGRLDDQVQVRGFRIELGEVESALRALNGVANACAFVDESDGRLVAVIEPHREQPSLLDDPRDALSRRLPPHVLPSRIHRVGQIPLTVNGKADRRAAARLPCLAECCG